MMIRIAICEDDSLHLGYLQEIVLQWEKINSHTVQISKYTDAEAFWFDWVESQVFDLLLLDIEMPGKNGMELANEVRKTDDRIQIIFITGHRDYMGAGYDVHALHYLLKPIKDDRLIKVLDLAANKMNYREPTLLVNDGRGLRNLKQNAILSIEAIGNTVEITLNNEIITVKKVLKEIEEELTETYFVRCHRSYMVHLAHVRVITRDSLEMDNGIRIPISRRKYKDVNDAFIKYHKGGA